MESSSKLLALNLPGGFSVDPPTGFPDSGYINGSNIMNFAISLVAALAIVTCIAFIIYSGFMWASSSGDKQKLEEARTSLTYSIIGLILVAMSFIIIRFIGSLLGTPMF